MFIIPNPLVMKSVEFVMREIVLGTNPLQFV